MRTADIAKLVAANPQLTASELRVASALAQHIDRFDEVRILQKELMFEAQVSQATLTRSLRKLEIAGFITTTRSRKRHNHFDKNVYLVAQDYVLTSGESDPSPISTGWGLHSIAQSETPDKSEQTSTETTTLIVLGNEQSTAGPGSSNGSNGPLKTSNYVPVKTYLKRKDYSKGTEENFENLKANGSGLIGGGATVSSVSMSVNDTVGPVSAGWGHSKKKSVVLLNNRDWKTRHHRPKSTWTPYDISAEFQALLNEESRRAVDHVDGNRIRGIVRKLRRDADSFAELEVHVARSVARDPVALKTIIDDVDKAPGVFYNVLNRYIDLGASSEDPDLWKQEFIAVQQAADIRFAKRDLNTHSV